MRFVPVPAVLAALVLGATGCSLGEVFSGSSTTATAPLETITVAATIEDGKHFGYVRSATTGSPATIEFDRAEFLTGAEAAAAAAAAGEEAFDYYIRNDAAEFVLLPVADGVTVTHVACKGNCKEGVAGDFAGFAASFEGDPSRFTLEDAYRGSSSQYWVTISGGFVTAIEEQYLP